MPSASRSRQEQLGRASAAEWAGPAALAAHIVNLARFSIGVPAAFVGIWGFWKLARTNSHTAAVLLAALAAGILALLPQGSALMRHHLPLLPLFALAIITDNLLSDAHGADATALFSFLRFVFVALAACSLALVGYPFNGVGLTCTSRMPAGCQRSSGKSPTPLGDYGA